MSRSYISKRLRERVSAQAKYRCGYCLTSAIIVGAPMEIEHLIPEALGGETIEENLWLACFYCNDYKNDRISAIDPLTQEVVALFNPRQQVWRDHFQWNNDATHVVGLTPTGRATIATLQLNRVHLVHARALWALVGWHPPLD